MKKSLSLFLIAMLVCSQSAFAQSATIPASGTLQGSTALTVTGGPLNFDSSGELIVQAPQTIQIRFADNQAGYQAVIVSTDNKKSVVDTVTGKTQYLGGLVGETSTDEVAGMRWKVFTAAADQTVNVTKTDGTAGTFTVLGYQSYSFASDVYPAGTTYNGESIAGQMTAAYVIEKNEMNDATLTPTERKNKLGYAVVIGDLQGSSVATATARASIWAPSTINVDATANAALKSALTAKNGTAWVKFMCDYNGKSAQTYSTSTLKLELVTIS